MKINKRVKYLIIIAISLVPLIAFIITFWDWRISKDPSDWSDFGSYIGGVYSIIVAFLVVFLARELSKRDEISIKKKKAVEDIYQQIIKVNIKHIDGRVVNGIFKHVQKYKFYIPEKTYQEVVKLANHYLEVKGGKAEFSESLDNSVKAHLKALYDA